MQTRLLAAFLLIFQINAQSQQVKGKITDEKNQPVPFATVYFQDIQTGTTSNLNGDYEINVPAGKHTITYKALGYKAVVKEIDLTGQVITVNVTLPVEIYQLKEVTISRSGEDPAYAIMRKAIALAPFHQREVDHYESSIYLKGTLYIDKIPKLVSRYATFESDGVQYKLKTGDVYVEESIVDITFNAPKLYKQKVRSVRTSIPGGTKNPMNPVLTIMSSFYEPEIMDIISPLSPQAFQHYKFRYDGFIEEGNFYIDKIKVIPRRKSQELFDGYVYIVENKWCLYSVDLNNSQFWGTMHINEMFSQVEKTAWLPVSYNIDVSAKMMGMKGRYKYVSSVKYNSIKLNEPLIASVEKKAPAKNNAPEPKPDDSKVKKIMAKDKITNREMRKVNKEIKEKNTETLADTITLDKLKELTSTVVDSMASKRDTSYWNEFRPVPLTPEEVKSYEEGPTQVLKKVKQDSIARSKDSTYSPKKNKIPFWILTGRNFYVNDKKTIIEYNGLIQLRQLSFNTVDGVRYGFGSKLIFKLDSAGKLTLKPWVGYSFARKDFMWEIYSELLYEPRYLKGGWLFFTAGHKPLDFNGDAGINPFINSVYTLFMRQNYMKLYESTYFSLKNIKRVLQNFNIISELRFDNINELENHSDYSFFYRNTRDFTPNIPGNPYYQSLGGTSYRSLVFSTGVSYTPSLLKKRISGNRFKSLPSFSVWYYAGIPGVFDTKSNFQKLSFGIEQRFNMPRDRRFNYKIKADYWLTSKNTYFADFSQMKTSPLPFSFSSNRNIFTLLPYYTYNTDKWSIEAHSYYTTNLLLLKRLPVISNRIWTENLYFNYLTTPRIKNYIELGYGVGQIWAVGELGIFTSFENFEYRSIGLKLNIIFD